MQKINKQNQKILLEISLFLNKALLEENKITYTMFQATENNLLKLLKR